MFWFSSSYYFYLTISLRKRLNVENLCLSKNILCILHSIFKLGRKEQCAKTYLGDSQTRTQISLRIYLWFLSLQRALFITPCSAIHVIRLYPFSFYSQNIEGDIVRKFSEASADIIHCLVCMRMPCSLG